MKTGQWGWREYLRDQLFLILNDSWLPPMGMKWKWTAPALTGTSFTGKTGGEMMLTDFVVPANICQHLKYSFGIFQPRNLTAILYADIQYSAIIVCKCHNLADDAFRIVFRLNSWCWSSPSGISASGLNQRLIIPKMSALATAQIRLNNPIGSYWAVFEGIFSARKGISIINFSATLFRTAKIISPGWKNCAWFPASE